MEVEHGTFTPLVFTTTGVMSHECSIFHKALAEKLSEKQGERYEVIMRYLRVKLSFLALKSMLLCLRGSRSHTTKSVKNVVIKIVIRSFTECSFSSFNNSQHLISVSYRHFKFLVDFCNCHFAECIVLYTLKIQKPLFLAMCN